MVFLSAETRSNRGDQPLWNMLMPHQQGNQDWHQLTRTRFLGVSFDCLDQDAVVDLLQQRRPDDPFCYVVTPNVDHIVRLAAQPALLAQYHRAWLCVCDSRPVQFLSKTVRRPLTHVTGSDLTKAVFENVLEPGDVVALIVANVEIATKLAALYPDVSFRWHVPPYGLLGRPDDLQAAADFMITQPARFTFVAIGSPQSELIVAQAQDSGIAGGTALCIGASLEFITGDRPRAPAWMNRSGLEWVHRIANEPRRLWRRYLFSIPHLLRLYWLELTGRAGG